MTTPVPSKLAHVVFRTADIDRMIAWYETVLGAHVAMRNDFIAFLTYDEEHHRIAFVADPRITSDERAVDRPGVEHIAFTYEGLADLLATYERLRVEGLTPYWTINHGPTTSLYYRDPDGNQVELQVDNFDDVDTLNQWMQSPEFEQNPIGVDFDVEELITRHRAGEPEAELLRRP